jgi:hypothetical protein
MRSGLTLLARWLIEARAEAVAHGRADDLEQIAGDLDSIARCRRAL